MYAFCQTHTHRYAGIHISIERCFCASIFKPSTLHSPFQAASIFADVTRAVMHLHRKHLPGGGFEVSG